MKRYGYTAVLLFFLVAAPITLIRSASIAAGGSGGGGAPSAAPAAGPAAASAAAPAAAAPAASSGGASTAAGPTNASAFLKMGRKSVFVLVYAADPVTTTFLSYELALNLSPVMDQMKERQWLVPEPAWSLADYATQCQNDPKTEGALVIYDVENDVGNFNFVFLANTYAHLYAKAMFVDCEAYTLPVDNAESGITTFSQTSTFVGTPPTPTTSVGPVKYSPPPTRSVQSTIIFPSPTPLAKPVGYQSQIQTTDSFAAPAQYQGVQTTNVIPTMTVRWVSSGEIDSAHFAANQYGVPFLTVAGLGAYLTSRQYSASSSKQTTYPLVPVGSVQVTNTSTGNNSSLPYGIAYLGASLSSLSTLTLGGANQSRVLKSAAASVASAIRRDLDSECYVGTTWKGVTRYGRPVPRPERATKMCDLFTSDL